MRNVDYAKLSEQYASFLVAVGGVSITVLTLVLGLTSPPAPPTEEHERLFLVAAEHAHLFLVAALTAATVSCFIGAHMMAETAAFFTRLGVNEETPSEAKKPQLPKETPSTKATPAEDKIPQPTEETPLKVMIPLGRRLFVLASSNIFIAITLVLFSIVLLPTATGKVGLAASLKLISHVIFLGVLLGALFWMAFAAIDRMGVGKKGWRAIAVALVAGLITGFLNCKSKELWPQATFIFIVLFSALSLIYFAVIFMRGKACTPKYGIIEMGIFSSGITISYASLVVTHFKIL